MSASKNYPQEKTQDHTLVIRREFDAPRQAVWKAWTDPERMKLWTGPKGYTAPVCKIDLRLGGKILTCMRSSEGQDFWSTGVYREIRAPERLVVTDSFADEHGNVVPASHYGIDIDFPLELEVRLRFEQNGNHKTKLTLEHVGLPAGQMAELTEAGWNESFDKLAELLKV